VSENWTNRLTASPTSSHAGVLFGGNTLIVQGGSGAAGTLLSTQAINIGNRSIFLSHLVIHRLVCFVICFLI
jgi:hypothetical protein